MGCGCGKKLVNTRGQEVTNPADAVGTLAPNEFKQSDNARVIVSAPVPKANAPIAA